MGLTVVAQGTITLETSLVLTIILICIVVCAWLGIKQWRYERAWGVYFFFMASVLIGAFYMGLLTIK